MEQPCMMNYCNYRSPRNILYKHSVFPELSVLKHSFNKDRDSKRSKEFFFFITTGFIDMVEL